jgi:AcrR family transcriptional regulator
MTGMPGRVKRPRRKPAERFHHGDLREAAVAEAFHVVDAKGPEALSVRALAQRLGVSDPAIYRHYENRDALLLAVARRGFVGLMTSVLAASAEDDPPGASLEAIGAAYVRFASEHRGWFRLSFSAPLQDAGIYEGEGAAELVHVAAHAEARIKQHLGRVVPADVLDDHYRAYWALAHGLASMVIERVFRRVETDAERVEVALRAIRIHVVAICGGERRRRGVSSRSL